MELKNIVKNLMPTQQRPYTGNSEFLNFENQSSFYQFIRIVWFISATPEIGVTFKWKKRLEYNIHIYTFLKVFQFQ